MSSTPDNHTELIAAITTIASIVVIMLLIAAGIHKTTMAANNKPAAGTGTSPPPPPPAVHDARKEFRLNCMMEGRTSFQTSWSNFQPKLEQAGLGWWTKNGYYRQRVGEICVSQYKQIY